ncbi:Fc.00g081310.m01.CDS01 [Cosmosporella sp. VM-42]
MDVSLEVFRSAISIETGADVKDVANDTSFADLEIDPLMSLAILETIQESTGLEFPASLFRDCATLSDIQKTLSLGTGANDLIPISTSHQLLVRDAYRQCDYLVGQFAKEAKVSNFWTEVYPTQRQLVLAYINETLSLLGCSLETISPGTTLWRPSGILSKHHRLVNAMFDILTDGGLVKRGGDGQVVRTSNPLNSTLSTVLYEKLIQEHPLHANSHRLLHTTGPRLRDCLTGAADPIKLLFGTSSSRDLLQEFYTNAPMFTAASKHLTALFRRIFFNASDERIEILEIGAGFGGTTSFVLDMLVDAGIPFRYTFTDVSPSFFNAAKKRYAHLPIPADTIQYEILDIEKTPPAQLRGNFHTVLSTNCIHATKDLTVSSANARKLLRPGGFFALIEFTTRIYWLDLVFGLLDGWWLFEDGRKHCLADESFWKDSLEAAGFGDVIWIENLVDGRKPNPQVIIACTL